MLEEENSLQDVPSQLPHQEICHGVISEDEEILQLELGFDEYHNTATDEARQEEEVTIGITTNEPQQRDEDDTPDCASSTSSEPPEEDTPDFSDTSSCTRKPDRDGNHSGDDVSPEKETQQENGNILLVYPSGAIGTAAERPAVHGLMEPLAASFVEEPTGGPQVKVSQVTLHQSDLERLENPNEFFNDNIIDFYVHW